MQKRRLPGTNIEITPIVFGAFAIGGWFWGGADEGEALGAIKAAIDNGINAIDTAPVYGMGQSEELVGRAIRGQRDRLIILTKFGMRWDTAEGTFTFDTKDNAGGPVQVYKYAGKRSVVEECERSLRRLQTDYIDLYQLHWPDRTTPIAETMEALQILLEQGKIRSAGVCNTSWELLAEARRSLPIVSDQVAYSMVNRDIEKDLLKYCARNEVGILAHTILQKGLLTGKIKPDHKFNHGDHRPQTPYFKTANIEKIDAALGFLAEIASSRNASLAQLAVNWTMHRPGVTAVLVGARNAEQVLDNVGAAGFRLNAEESGRIEGTLGQLTLDL
jgi:aryl-alcohol dehydrogenase-like predicted oxidoreductase